MHKACGLVESTFRNSTSGKVSFNIMVDQQWRRVRHVLLRILQHFDRLLWFCACVLACVCSVYEGVCVCGACVCAREWHLTKDCQHGSAKMSNFMYVSKFWLDTGCDKSLVVCHPIIKYVVAHSL